MFQRGPGPLLEESVAWLVPETDFDPEQQRWRRLYPSASLWAWTEVLQEIRDLSPSDMKEMWEKLLDFIQKNMLL